MSTGVGGLCRRLFTMSISSIRNAFLILCGTPPFCRQKSLNSSGLGLYKVLNALHRDAGPCWLQCFPQLCQVGWMFFGWWTILDTHRKPLSMKNPAAVLDRNWCAWHLLPTGGWWHLDWGVRAHSNAWNEINGMASNTSTHAFHVVDTFYLLHSSHYYELSSPFKGTYIFCLCPLNGTHIQPMYQLYKGLQILI